MKVVTAFDLETTGLPRKMELKDPQYPRMIQIGGVTWTSDDVVHGRIQNYVQQPDKSTSVAAERIHGIDDFTSFSKGIPEQVALGWLTNSIKVSDILVGWALDFDLNIARAALIRYGKDPDTIITPGKQKFDLQELLTPRVGLEKEDGSQRWPSLNEGYEFVFGKPLYIAGEKHRAGKDADACRELFMELWDREWIEDLARRAA